jgi:ankyrin repeat protein
MKRAVFALLLILTLIACDPGPMPEVPRRNAEEKIDYKKYWFPTDSIRQLPLGLALQSGDMAELRRLLEQGTSPNLRWGESGDRLPIQEVLEGSSYGYRIPDPVEALSLLLKHGADPNARWCPFESRQISEWRATCTARKGMTPLNFATIIGQRRIVELLLAAGADPGARDFTGRSPLDYAADEVVVEMISRALFPDLATRDRQALEWLKLAGGESYDPSESGTPLLRALVGDDDGRFAITFPAPNSTLVDFFTVGEDRMLARVRILMRIGADPNERVSVRSPLALALRNRSLRVARELLRNGARADERWCELYFPPWLPSTAVPRHLIVHEGDPHQDPACKADNGITPLMWIATAGEGAGVQLLLEFKADRSLKDWAGRTALDYATAPEVRKLLLN